MNIWAYCLLNNNAHFIDVIKKADSFARCFADAHVRSTRQINRCEGWKGHLWQARFGSSILVKYICRQRLAMLSRTPFVRGGAQAVEYAWTSAAWQMGKVESDPLVTGNEMLR